jgi:hypothetical protein
MNIENYDVLDLLEKKIKPKMQYLECMTDFFIFLQVKNEPCLP